MKKVLYVSNYCDKTGWGNSGLNNILALDSVGIEVVPRSITFNGSEYCENARVRELEKNSSLGADICIQHVLPPLYSYRGGMKNIGYCELETYDISYSGWPQYMNLMDEIWVPNLASKNCCERSGVVVPVNIVPHALDMSQYENVEQNVLVKELKNGYNFFFVGEFNSRKNIGALLKAYYLAFDRDDDVNLFLKLNGPTSNIDQNIALYENFEESIRRELNLGYYRPVSVYFDFLDKQDLLSIMTQCHCFVCPSYGESCCIPAMEAMALGKPVIWTDGIGIDDYGIGKAVKSRYVPCSYNPFFVSEIYSGYDRWLEIDVIELSKAMKEIRLLGHLDHDYNTIRTHMNQFDIKEIGQEMLELLK